MPLGGIIRSRDSDGRDVIRFILVMIKDHMTTVHEMRIHMTSVHVKTEHLLPRLRAY
jgi:hypothetical protein